MKKKLNRKLNISPYRVFYYALQQVVQGTLSPPTPPHEYMNAYRLRVISNILKAD